MTFSFLNKLVVVTGAASGIGRATASLLARRGALISISDSDNARLAAVKQEVTALSAAAHKRLTSRSSSLSTATTPVSTVFASKVDVRSETAVSAWIQETLAHFRVLHIDGAVNSAGVTNLPSNLAEADSKIGPRRTRDVLNNELDFVWDVNVRGTLNCLKAQLPRMRPGSTSQQENVTGSAIVNAASVSGLMGLPGYLPYVSSKHAVVGMTRTVAKEEAATGIRINAVAPAFIATPMLERVAEGLGTSLSMEMFGAAGPAMGRLGTSEEVAEVILFLLSPSSSYLTGTTVPIDGGLFC